MKLLLLILPLLLPAPLAQASVFDAADILPKNAGAIGGFGEILLSDPTSEGIEAHARYGLTDDWNLGAILGTGTKEKNFRMGGEAVYNLLPDWEGQLGLSFDGEALFLRRDDTSGLQLRVGPMLHKRIKGWNSLPANIYGGLFWQLEARQSQFTSGTQLVLGSNFDVGEHGRYYMATELGLRLARTDSYILVGLGIRLGDLTFGKKESHESALPSKTKHGNRAQGSDYTDDDFKN